MFFNGKNVLVTGGASFIGSHLVDNLLFRGSCVRVADDFSSGKLENLEYNFNEESAGIWRAREGFAKTIEWYFKTHKKEDVRENLQKNLIER